MFEKFIKDNGIYLLENIFKDYLGTQFFPSKFLCNDKFDGNKISDVLKVNLEKKDRLNNLYIHIPFCKTRCFYCHCYTYVGDNYLNEYEKYVEYLQKELLQQIGSCNYKIKLNSIFIGGGTPNIIGANLLKKVYKLIGENFDLSELKQNNIDLNPYCLDFEIIDVLHKYGVNRVTYAIQSFDEEVLRQNSRYNSEIDHKKLVGYLNSKGIKVNIDLMIGIKGQTFDICKSDIDKALKLKFDNISLNYFIQSENVKYKISDESKEMIQKVKRYFNKLIYNNYNKSANLQEETYLKQKVNLIGVGNGAITHIHGNLMGYNNFSLKDYYKNIDNGVFYSNLKYLSQKEEMIKFLFFNLVFGVDLKFLDENYGGINSIKKELEFLENSKIIKIENNYIRPLVNNFKLYLYSTILLIDYFDIKTKDKKYNQVEKVQFLKKFFLSNGEKIDEDY